MPNGFIFYDTYYNAFGDLEDDDRLTIYDALIEYGLFGTVPVLPKRLMAYMMLVMPGIDSAKRRYQARVENGKKGGRPKKDEAEQPCLTEQEPDINLNISNNNNNNISINNKHKVCSGLPGNDPDGACTTLSDGEFNALRNEAIQKLKSMNEHV